MESYVYRLNIYIGLGFFKDVFFLEFWNIFSLVWLLFYKVGFLILGILLGKVELYLEEVSLGYI